MIGGIYFAAATLAGVVGVVGALPAPSTAVGIVIGGLDVRPRVRVDGFTVHDVLNDAPNTATFTIEGEAPAVGQRVEILVGARLCFAGPIQTIDQAYESRPDHLAWHVTAIDDAATPWRPFGTWVTTSATTIAQAITATYAPGFAAGGIEAGLPPVTIVFDGSETFIAALARLATAVGGYCKIFDRAVSLFTEDLAAPPAPIDDAHRFLASPPIQMNTDSSQLRTRVYGKGYGENVLADIPAGETLLPIPDGAMFPPLGGSAIVGLTADGAQSDVVTFASVSRPVGGTLVGPGAAPANGPTLELAAGGVTTPGVHKVGVVHGTAAGLSLIGPLTSITTGTHPPPATAPLAGTALAGTGPDMGAHDYAVAFVTAYGETVAGPISNAVTTSTASGQVEAPGGLSASPFPHVDGPLAAGSYDYIVTFTTGTGETDGAWNTGVSTGETGFTMHLTSIDTGPPGVTGRKIYRNGRLLTTLSNNVVTTFEDNIADNSGGAFVPVTNTTGSAVQRVPVSNIPLGPGGVTARKLYRRFNGAGTFKLVTTLANNTTTTYTDSVTNAALGANALATATAIGNQILATGIPTGGATVTGRHLYITQAGGASLHYFATLADNTTTTATINVSDATLAAQPGPPATDTSGLQQPQGQVAAGSPTLIVASPAPFSPTGGWVITGGGQVVRYTGVSGQFLTGIPAAGAGAIVTTILYGQQATPSPTLVGVTGLTRPMAKGSAVHIWIRRDDFLAQAEHAARTGDPYGVVEFLIVDQRRGVESLAARCDADLAMFSRPIITVRYATRDLQTQSGKTIVIDLPSQGIHQTLTIQEVTITEIGLAPGLAPRFTVTASSVRFSLEDTLRRLVAVGPVSVHT